MKSSEEKTVDKVLRDIFNGMAGAFDPSVAACQRAVIQYDITAPDGVHSYQLNVANGKCNVAKGGKEAARITLALALPDFLRLIGGKLRVSGDMQFLLTIETVPPWLKRQVN